MPRHDLLFFLGLLLLAAPALAADVEPPVTNSTAIEAQNTFTDFAKLTAGTVGADDGGVVWAIVWAQGTLAASTVTIQCKLPGQADGLAVDLPNGTLTAPGPKVLQLPRAAYCRAGVKTGDYGGSDSITITIQ